MKRGPRLVAITVDHGLRKEAAREASEVKKLAKTLAIEHQTLRWRGTKPTTGVPAAARDDMDTVVALQLDASAEGIAPVR